MCLAAGCDKNRLPSPNNVLSNSSELTAALLNAKYNSEKEAREATRILKVRLNAGKNLYEDARAAHNLAISQMRQALVTSGTHLSTDKLSAHLSDADTKRDAFHDWCNRSYKAENNPGQWCGSCELIDVILDVASLYTEWVKMQEARDEQQRTIIAEELTKCEWDSWETVRE